MSGAVTSMTGFGRASGENERYRITVEARSLNHRALDVVVRIREGLRQLEMEVRDLVKARLNRGRVDLSVSVQALGGGTTAARVDGELIRQLLDELGELRGEGAQLDVRLGDLLRIPGVVVVEGGEEEWLEADGQLVCEIAAQALDRLLETRRSEGEKLRQELAAGVERLASVRGRLGELRAAAVSAYLDRLRERVSALVGDVALDPARLELEVALLVEKSDVAEELDRLTAHLGEASEVLGGEPPIGKRFDFLLQEVLRELNTVGAKCRDLEMSRLVVDARLICEQMREQVQNVE